MTAEGTNIQSSYGSIEVTVPKFDAAETYAKNHAEFLKKLEKQQKENNTYYLQRMLNGLNLNCTNYWNTKYALDGVQSLQYHLNCNLNCDSSIHTKIASLKAQQPILEEKLAEFEQGKSDAYTLQLDSAKQNNTSNINSANLFA